MSVWQLTTNVAAILVLPTRHSVGFTFVAGRAIHEKLKTFSRVPVRVTIVEVWENLKYSVEALSR